jgi:ketosteroid isomerase-like protein
VLSFVIPELNPHVVAVIVAPTCCGYAIASATHLKYPSDMPTEDPTAAIRTARAHSNRSITRRNLLGVGSSLASDFVAIIGDGTFVPTRDAYLKLFKQGFDTPKTALTYERIPDTISIAATEPLAAEHGHWIATAPDGSVAFTGTYMAMWRNSADGWKIRSELYVTLVANE